MRRLLFVADGRSPIALNWIRHFVEAGDEVHLATTSSCESELRLASFEVVPVAFSGVNGRGKGIGDQGIKGRLLRRFIPVNLRTAIRQRLGPVTLKQAANRLSEIVARIRPELVHAMRIPYEGMLAASALTDSKIPLLVSVWGNDFTLHAAATSRMAGLTRLALRRASALHADCRRDVRLAQAWGFPGGRRTTVLPGNGGVRKEIFYPRSETEMQSAAAPVVIQPRGFRAYVRNDTFFRSIPLVLEKRPEVRFLCPAMQGEEEAERWLNTLGIAGSVDLLPRQAPQEMAALFRQAQAAVSPTTHDGTPNTLLEAMACGCFPLAGDLEPLREWITPGVNGLLFEPGEPASLSGAVLLALEQTALRRQARALNLDLIAGRAEHELVMRQAEDFYTSIINFPFL